MKPIISFDLACTLFWEHGCDPRYPDRPVKHVFSKLLRFLKDRGVEVDDTYTPEELMELYYSLWRNTQEKGPWRELWHRYLLLKFLYRIGARVDHVLLDEAYRIFIRERAKLFILPRRNRILLEYLKGRGYTILLTTGTGAHDLPLEILRVNNASHYFSLVFSTQLVGIPKKDPRFYEELVEVLGVKPSGIIHIGDSIEYDVKPAKKAGLKTIYYGWRTQCRAAESSTHCIIDLWDLVNYLL